MVASRALIEVAPSASYLLSSVAQDDVVIRTESALRTLYLGASNTLPLRVSAAGVYVAGTLTADAYSNIPVSAAATWASNTASWASNSSAPSGWSVGAGTTSTACNVVMTGTLTVGGLAVVGASNYADLSMAGLGFTSATVAAPTPALTKTLKVGGRVVGNRLILSAGSGDGTVCARVATTRRNQYMFSALYPTLWAASAQKSLLSS
jgi:hypothetical protein